MSSILFLGASGQTGGAFLAVFRKKYPDIPITAYLRSTALDSALQALGNVTVAHGTFEDYDKIEKLASEHPIIINCAASRDGPLTHAILRGIRAQEGKKRPLLLHLSGAGNFVDHGTSGNYVPQEHPFNDANPDAVRKITPTTKPNGPTDHPIMEAAAAGEVVALFVSPGGIYGASTNHLGLSAGHEASANAPGVWVGWMLQNIETLGFSPYVGEGTSIFPLVHVDDVVELMILVFQKALDVWDSYKPEDVYSHYFLGVDERHDWKTLATTFAELQYRKGKLPAPITKSVTYDEAGIVKGYIGGNIIVINDNSKSLGWVPMGLGIVETLERIK